MACCHTSEHFVEHTCQHQHAEIICQMFSTYIVIYKDCGAFRFHHTPCLNESESVNTKNKKTSAAATKLTGL